MDSNVLIEAINFSKFHPDTSKQLGKSDSNEDMVLLKISCEKTLFEGRGNGYFLRVKFEYKSKGSRTKSLPKIFLDLDYNNGEFKALPAI